MKKQDLDKMLDLVDEKYIDEANPKKFSFWDKIKRPKIISYIATGLCAALLITNIVTIIPLIKQGPGGNTTPPASEGGDIGGTGGNGDGIVEIVPPDNENGNEIYHGSSFLPNVSTPDSSYDKLLDVFYVGSDKDEINDELADATDKFEQDSVGNSSNDITDNQVAGVIEGDLVKRTDTHIFHLRGNYLAVYDINKDQSRLVNTFEIKYILDYISNKVDSVLEDDDTLKEEILDSNAPDWEMLLSSDGKQLTIIANTKDGGLWNESKISTSVVMFLDVSDPCKIGIKNVITLFGNYQTSRLVGDQLLVFTSHYASLYKLLIPQYDNGSGFVRVEADKICIDKEKTKELTTIYSIDMDTHQVKDACAYTSYKAQGAYVSRDRIYLSRMVYENSKYYTDIAIMGYKDRFVHIGTVRVEGCINNQYSFDEYNGILRVVTTNRGYSTPTNASLYCIDLTYLRVVYSLKRFAPDGESVRSVRFDKNLAYVCTAVQMTDPVFVIDLSDLESVKVYESDEIYGYSTSLINIGNDLLVGIGYGQSTRYLKIELYKKIGDEVVSIDKYEVLASFSLDYKSYMVNRDLGLVGLGYSQWVKNAYVDKYLVLQATSDGFVVIDDYLFTGTNSTKRAFVHEGYIYMLSNTYFKVEKLIGLVTE